MDLSGKWISTYKNGIQLIVTRENENLFVFVQSNNPKNHGKLMVDGDTVYLVGTKKGKIQDKNLIKWDKAGGIWTRY